MCFVLLKCWGSFAITRAPEESLYRIGTFRSKASSPFLEWMVDVPALTLIPVVCGASCCSSCKNIDVHRSSLAAPARATYSASTELFATVSWSREDQLHANLSTIKAYPNVDLLQLHEPAQSLSAHPASIHLPVCVPAERFIPIVPLRYLSICLAAVRCSPDGFVTNCAQQPTANAMSGLLPCAICQGSRA